MTRLRLAAAAVGLVAVLAGCSSTLDTAPPPPSAGLPDDTASLTRCRVDAARDRVEFGGRVANPHPDLRSFLIAVRVTAGGVAREAYASADNMVAGGWTFYYGTAPAGGRRTATCSVDDVASRPVRG